MVLAKDMRLHNQEVQHVLRAQLRYDKLSASFDTRKPLFVTLLILTTPALSSHLQLCAVLRELSRGHDPHEVRPGCISVGCDCQ
jgi:hypothetical protein